MDGARKEPAVFEPEVKLDEGYGKGCVDVKLSHGLSLVIDTNNNRASFHFSGSMAKIKYDDLGNRREEFRSKKGTLRAVLKDILLGLENLKKVLKDEKISIPDKIELSTITPFLARLYSGLPESSVKVRIFLPDNTIQERRVSEAELRDLLKILSQGYDYSLSYDYMADLSASQNKAADVIKIIDDVFKPRLFGLLNRLE